MNDNVNPNTASSNQSTEFKTPKNPVDPIVVFDPEYDFSNIIMPLTDYDAGIPSKDDAQIDTLSNDGVNTPLMKLNNKVIFPNKIYALNISIKNFLPEIYAVIEDEDNNVQATDIPGMNNIITIILTAPVDGANKKISLDFYITECKFNEDSTITYKGEFKGDGLKQVKYTQIGDSKLSTYEFLEKIAKELKLGFACSEKCKDIKDNKWRQIYSKTYKDYIAQELSRAGLDEDSIFDAWIDNFGYLVMVNVPYIMNTDIDPQQLTTKVITGVSTELKDNEVPKQNVDEVLRIITNSKETCGIHNLFISDYHSIVNNENILHKGTLNRYYYLSSPCDQNLISQEQIQITENSVDGITGADEYKYENIEFIGSNQLEDDAPVCELFQEQIITNYFNKIYGKMLDVTLDVPNYSLQRGMLVTVFIEEYEPNNKQAIINNGDNALMSEESDETEIPVKDDTDREIIIDENNGIINPELSGIYYIKAIEFNYNGNLEKINQKLTLIKKGLLSNIQNKYTNTKIVSKK